MLEISKKALDSDKILVSSSFPIKICVVNNSYINKSPTWTVQIIIFHFQLFNQIQQTLLCPIKFNKIWRRERATFPVI